jgi:hypothetical protein
VIHVAMNEEAIANLSKRHLAYFREIQVLACTPLARSHFYQL